ncbi:glycosyltransferase family 4 protein [Roseateles sp. BYS96W]|uniref:Glycosyltransferase family 4 protein n=1 Tax=Pelomonas nitida TaxID=3299027 RepID=A0ABW7G4L4_9BURK
MIVVVNPQFYGVHGIARYLDSYLSNLPAAHMPVTLITGDEHKAPRSYAGVDIIDIPLVNDRLSLTRWGLAARKTILEIHRRSPVHCVNFHWPPLIPGLFLPKEIPLVLTAHTTYLGMSGRFYEPRRFEGQWGATSLAIKMWMERRIFARTSKVIALTEQGRQEVLQYGYSGPIAVIPNGADTVKFQPDASVEKDIDVLFSGRIEKRKGSVPMVALCKRLLEKRPGLRICIVGFGEDDAWVREQLAGLGDSVRMTGKVPFSEMVRYYARSHVYASTSYYEGLPGTCLEAMAMQLPAVVFDFLFYRGLVEPQQTGLVFAPNDIDAMSGGVLQLLDQPELAARMGRAGRALLEKDYAWKRLGADVQGVLES